MAEAILLNQPLLMAVVERRHCLLMAKVHIPRVLTMPLMHHHLATLVLLLPPGLAPEP